MNHPRAQPWWKSWSLLTGVAVFFLAVALQGLPVFRDTPRSRGAHLAATIPNELTGGWSAQEVPLGANEFISNEVEKVLNYDDVLNRAFSRGGQRFGLYIAYWGTGKMPTRLVASHTPDRCWTENGWKCLSMRFHQTGLFSGVALQPAEWRVFEPPVGGEKTYVIYWHLVQGRTYDYGQRFNNIPDPFRWWKDAVQQAVLGSQEQYFIRLTSNEPLENLSNDPGFREILRQLAGLGLNAKAQATARKGS